MTPDTAAVERVADALSHAQMLLLAVEANDPKPELAMRVKDLIAALPPPEETAKGWRFAFDSSTPRDHFGGAVMAAEPDAQGFVTIQIRQSDAHAIIDLIDAAERVLALSPPEGEAPKGWKLVPVEPTPKMLQDAAFNLSDEFGPEFVKPLGNFARAAYTAMLAAAPVPPLGD